MIATLVLIGSLAILCFLFASTAAYALGEVKGLTRGYADGQRSGYYQGYADMLMGTKDTVEVTQDTGEVEVMP